MTQDAIEATPAIRLGYKLRQARLAKNMTQSEVAAEQFSVSYISAVERGQIRPSLGALEKLSDRLQISVAELLRADVGDIPTHGLSGGYLSLAEKDDVEAQMREAQILVRQGKAEEALNLLSPLGERGMSLREQAMYKWHLAFTYNALRRNDEARRDAQDGLQLAERIGDPDLRERMRLELSQAYSNANKRQPALDQLHLCLEAIEKGVVLDPIFKLRVNYSLGNEHWLAGDHETAVQFLREASTLASEVLDPERLGLLYARLSATARAQGDTRNAKSFASRSVAAYEEATTRRLGSQVAVRLGRAFTQAGMTEEAVEQLRGARDRAERQADAQSTADADVALATLYLKQERTNDAAEAAKRALALSTELGDELLQAEAHVALAQVQELKKDNTGADRSYEEAIDLMRKADAVPQLSDAFARYSAFLERRGNSKKALEILKQAWQLRETTSAL